jgi:hypothetical protein
MSCIFVDIHLMQQSRTYNNISTLINVIIVVVIIIPAMQGGGFTL